MRIGWRVVSTGRMGSSHGLLAGHRLSLGREG